MPDPHATYFAAAALLAVPIFYLLRAALTLAWQSLRLRHLPGPKYGVLGVLPQFKARMDKHRLFAEWADEFGPVFHIRVLHNHFIVVSDPKLIAEAVRCKDLDKPQKNIRPIDRATGRHADKQLLTSRTGEGWRAVRKAVAVAFSSSNMRAAYPRMRAACSQLVDVLREVGPAEAVDMDAALSRESLDVIGWMGFDRDMGATRMLVGDDVAGAAMEAASASMHELEENLRNPARRLFFLNSGVRKGKSAYRRFHTLTEELLKEVRGRAAAGCLAPTSIAAHLLAIRDPKTGAPLPDGKLAAEFAILFTAGFETTGHTAAWTLYAVSQAPGVEARIVQELAALGLTATPGAPAPRQIEWDDLPRLTYLNTVIKEAMRLYPAGGIATFRTPTVNRDVVLGGGKLVVPPGVVLHMPIAAVHHARANWENPLAFDPDRWLQDGAATEEALGRPMVNGRVAKRYIPFSQGARDCVGQALAQLNLTTTLAQLLGHFTFVLAEQMGGAAGVRARESTTFTLQCAEGMWMHAVPRVPVPA